MGLIDQKACLKSIKYQLTMKYLFSILLTGLIMTMSVDTQAQDYSRNRKGKSKSKTTETTFAEKLWYGGSFDLGLTSNQFNFGLAPMSGYKLVGNLSAGVRLPIEYTYIKVRGTGGTSAKFNALDFGGGIFSRFKIVDAVFLHAEFNYLWVTQPVTQGGFLVLDPENPGKLLTMKDTENQFNIGAGYNSSGGGDWGYELSILYNALLDDLSDEIPWIIRAGVNYRF